MKAVIGSLNESKINGARRALNLLGIDSRNIISVNVKGYKDQPIGFDEIFIGAALRALEAIKYLERLDEAEYGIGIGIEAGIVKLHDIWFSGQLAIVTDNQKYSVGLSSFFPLPNKVVDMMIYTGQELRQVMKEISGYTKIAETIGAIGYFSKGYMTRADLSYQAVLAAILPWINEDIYKPRPVSELWETLKRAKVIE